jgi:hypothetical protein
LSAKKQSLGLVMRLLGSGTMACHVDPGICFFNTPVGSFRIGLTHLAAGPRRNPRTRQHRVWLVGKKTLTKRDTVNKTER